EFGSVLRSGNCASSQRCSWSITGPLRSWWVTRAVRFVCELKSAPPCCREESEQKNEYIRPVPRASCIFASYDADRHRALTCRISCEAFPRQTGWLLSRCTFRALIGSTGHEFAAKVR